MKLYKVSCTVMLSFPGKKYNGLVKSLKILTASRMITVEVTGFNSGKIMVLNICAGVHPSIKAASSSSTGIELMKPRYSIVVNGICSAVSIKIMPGMVL